jgi:arylsulfatase A-like enzyme
VAGSPSPGPPAAAAARPDIVLVVVDTLRRDHLPFHGYAKDTAPFLSRLARESVVFERAHATSSWTAPATASLLTSLYQQQHGVTSGIMATRRAQRRGERVRLNRLPEAVETLPEVLARAGYSTFALTLNPNISSKLGFAQGFGRFRNLPREDAADELNKRLFNWRARLLGSRPYFLYLHYLDPHGPYRENAPWFDRGATDEARIVSAYDSEVSFFDHHFQQAFERLGWERETLLVVTSDHGEGFEPERGFGGHGHTLYGELLDVPLVMLFPDRRAAGRRVGERVSHLDLLPTLAEYAGVKAEAAEGRSLLGLVDGAPAPPGSEPRTLFAHLRRIDVGARPLELHATLHGDWKLIEGPGRAPLLFDLARDPGERVNLAQRRADVRRDLERRRVEFERAARRYAAEESDVDLDPEAQERLRALGYVR